MSSSDEPVDPDLDARTVNDGEEGVERYHKDLYRIARRELQRMVRSGTIDTVALVNEAYLRVQSGDRRWNDRGHFLASMTTIIRHVLIDYARERNAQRRGGDWQQVTASVLDRVPGREDPIDLIALESALSQLGERSPRMEKVVELRVFGGLTSQEIADALDTSTATVTRDMRLASAFLAKALADA
jgi:RNA polymerase sigma factor (TIGR02999 family)